MLLNSNAVFIKKKSLAFKYNKKITPKDTT